LSSGLSLRAPLVGRANETSGLRSHLDKAIEGKGSTVLISGEAGLGKTRLVNEFIEYARGKGVAALSGWCLSEGSVSYFPFIEAFKGQPEASITSRDKDNLSRNMGVAGWLKGPDIKPAASTLNPEIDRDKMFEAISNTLISLSEKKPIILFLDDLHWADDLSLAMLHYISRKCRGSHLLIIGTYRPEELQAKEGKTHTLQDTMLSMSREGLISRLELTPLNKESTSELLSRALQSIVDPKLVEKIFTEAEGNPLFTIETLQLLIDDGTLVKKGGGWVLLTPIDNIKIPGKVLDVINRRIAHLGKEEKKLLGAASVCGYNFDGATLSGTLNADLAEVLQSLAEIEEKQRLIHYDNNGFSFSHHKVREAIYTSLPAELRRLYHSKAASTMEKELTPTIQESFLTSMALHYVEAGTPEKAFKYLVQLGEKAVNLFANIQAIEYLDKALEATNRSQSLATDENLGKIYGLRGRARLGQGLAPRAVEDLEVSLRHYEKLSDESMLPEAQYLLGNAYAVAGRIDESFAHLDSGLQLSRRLGNRNIECRCLYDLTWPLMTSTDNIEKVPIGLAESTRISEEVGDKITLAHNNFWLGIFHNFAGDFSEAIQHLEKAVKISDESGDKFYNLFARFILGMARAGNGEFDKAIDTLETCRKKAEENGIDYFAPRTRNALGWVHHELYDISGAIEYNKASLETAKAQIALPPALLNLGFDYLSLGDKENSKKYFEEAKDALHLHQCVQWRYDLKSKYGLGCVALTKGEYNEALVNAESALDIAMKAKAKKHIANCLRLKAEALDFLGRGDDAIQSMNAGLEYAERVFYPPQLWETHRSFGRLYARRGDKIHSLEENRASLNVLEDTLSRLKDKRLRDALASSAVRKELQSLCA